MEEPAAKRSKISPLTNHGVKVANLKQTSCVAGAAESPGGGGELCAASGEGSKAGDGDFFGHDDLPSNGLAVHTGPHHEEDDRSSHASSSDWTPQPQIGSYSFIQQHIRETDPRTILRDLLPETVLPPDLDDMTLWQIIINISEPPKRKKRKDINTLEDVVRLLHESKRILVLTGAGVSVSCGIPDFRSRDGIYARLAVDFPDLPDPQAMFDLEYFRRSFATASCLVCKHKVDCEAIREDIFNQVVPHCPRCPDIPLAIMKPDIVFFGENLPEMFHRAMKQDKDEVDLLIVIGSSLKVRPVALIPKLLGDCDVIVNELCHRLGGDFEQLCYNTVRLTEITEKPPRLPEQLPSDALPASSDAAQEELTQHSTDSVSKPSEERERSECHRDRCEETAEPSELSAEDTPKEEAAEVKSQTSNLELRRRCWMSRINRSPISKRLETGQYLFQAPNHYVFHGAEVYSDSEDETSSSCGSDSDESECSVEGGEEDSEPEEAATLAVEGETCLRDTIQHTLANEATSSVQTDNTSEKTQSTTHL
ncbi:NAD-dependent protein deacetylase sirtuin-1 [Larimichthys crocea]|uniref:Uncharacterized protein n=1 Tax=Larimichthys crocea TaxID=215358 RepID=A0ACD3QCG3_LARCR|nr:NAD-dependent protein deacetylase sirtuin-1 [Larimichthys crocea]